MAKLLKKAIFKVKPGKLNPFKINSFAGFWCFWVQMHLFITTQPRDFDFCKNRHTLIPTPYLLHIHSSRIIHSMKVFAEEHRA